MSDPIKEGADVTGEVTQSTGSPLFNLVVKCYRDVYRRADIAFKRGENTLVGITREQVEIIERDSVLKIVSGEAVPPSPESGAVDHVGMDGELNTDQLNAEQLTLRILSAVGALDKGNPDNFTTAGTPKVAVVSAALGETITAEQLKTALASVLQNGDA